MSHSETGLADSFVAQNKRLAVPVAIAVSRIVGKRLLPAFYLQGQRSLIPEWMTNTLLRESCQQGLRARSFNHLLAYPYTICCIQ